MEHINNGSYMLDPANLWVAVIVGLDTHKTKVNIVCEW